MSCLPFVYQVGEDFYGAHHRAIELAYTSGASVTPSYRESFCLVEARARKAYGFTMQDLPTESFSAANNFYMDKIDGKPNLSENPSTPIYNDLVDTVWEIKERNGIATREEIDAILAFIAQRTEHFNQEDRLTLVPMITDDIYGLVRKHLKNPEEVLRPLMDRFVTPIMQETYDLFLRESSQCTFDGAARVERDAILVEMRKQMDVAKKLVTSAVAPQRFRASA